MEPLLAYLTSIAGSVEPKLQEQMLTNNESA